MASPIDIINQVMGTRSGKKVSPVEYPRNHPLDPASIPMPSPRIDQLQELMMQLGVGGHGGDGDYIQADQVRQAGLDVQSANDPSGRNDMTGQPGGQMPERQLRGYLEMLSDGHYTGPWDRASMQAEVDRLMDADPNNANPNLPPMEYEDEENGYWDAQNMGNGKGDSFVMENGQQRMADPVGNGPMVPEGMTPAMILEMISGARPGEGRNEAPPGPDYDTLVGIMDEMGFNLDDLSPEDQEMLMNNIGAQGPDQTAKVIEQFMRRHGNENGGVPADVMMQLLGDEKAR